MVTVGSAFLIEQSDGRLKAIEGVVVVEFTLHKANTFTQLLPNLFAKWGSGMLPYRIVHDLGEVLIDPVASRKADQCETWWQEPSVG